VSEISELFTELLFGSGALIGLTLLMAVAFIVSAKVKYAASIFVVIFLFLAWEYFSHITATSMNAWYFLICLVVAVFLGGFIYQDVTH